MTSGFAFHRVQLTNILFVLLITTDTHYIVVVIYL